jgi:methionine-rich copper-binding protein CopC
MSNATPKQIARRAALAPAWFGLLLALTLCLTETDHALAHAHYAHSQPSIGQVLATAPLRVDIYTDSDMRKLAGANVISVTGPDGTEVDDGNTVLDDTNRQYFSVGLLPNLPPGRYVVSFKTLSDEDGDVDSGRFAFYIGAGPTEAQKSQDAGLNGPVQFAAGPTARSGPRVSTTLLVTAGGVIVLLTLVTAGTVALRRKRGASRP